MVRALTEYFCDVSGATVEEWKPVSGLWTAPEEKGTKDRPSSLLRGAETSAAPGWLSILLLLSATDTGRLLVLAGSTAEGRIEAWRSQKPRT